MKKVDWLNGTALLLISGTIAHIFLSHHAIAQSAPLETLDQNKDGFISIKEAVSNPELLAIFGKLDLDGDGKLSAQELKKVNS